MNENIVKRYGGILTLWRHISRQPAIAWGRWRPCGRSARSACGRAGTLPTCTASRAGPAISPTHNYKCDQWYPFPILKCLRGVRTLARLLFRCSIIWLHFLLAYRLAKLLLYIITVTRNSSSILHSFAEFIYFYFFIYSMVNKIIRNNIPPI